MSIEIENRSFPQSFLLSFLLHAALLAIVLACGPALKPPPAALPPIEITMVEGPVGDNGQGERFRPKEVKHAAPRAARAPVQANTLRIPVKSQAVKAPVQALVQAPVLPKQDDGALEAALKERLKSAHEEETARASQLGSTLSGAKEGASNSQGGTKGAAPGPAGISDDGTGMSGQLAARGILRKVLPSYPDWAEKKWLEGDVRLRLWVNSEGEVTKVSVIGNSGTPDFDRRAVSSLRQWRFSPIGSADEVQTGEISIQFRLGQ